MILGALASPIDTLAEKLFWVHMTQHVMLLTIAAPLIVLGAPWNSIWRPLPLGFRRTSQRPSAAPAGARRFGRSRACWRGRYRPGSPSTSNLVPGTCPAVYDLAVRDRAVHDLEHVTFLVFGVLLWAQVIDSPPLRARLSAIHRVYYIVAAAVVGWIIALVLIFADLAALPGLRPPCFTDPAVSPP